MEEEYQIKIKLLEDKSKKMKDQNDEQLKNAENKYKKRITELEEELRIQIEKIRNLEKIKKMEKMI